MKHTNVLKIFYLFIFLNLFLYAFPLQGEIAWTQPDVLFVEDSLRTGPILSINQQGDALIGWVSQSHKAIEFAEYDYIEHVLESPKIAYPCSEQTELLDVVLSDRGEIFVLWLDHLENAIKAAKYDSQRAIWLDTVTIPDAHLLEKPVLKIDPFSNALVGWTKFTGFEYQVQAVYFAVATNRWDTIITLSPIGYNCHLQKFAFDSEGNAVAVWKSTLLQDQVRRGNNYGIQAVRFSGSNREWTHSPIFFDVLSDFILTTPDIIFDSQDNFIILWKKEPISFGSEILQYISYDSSAQKWGNKKDIPTRGIISNPRLICLNNKVYAFWQSAYQGQEQIQSIELVYPNGVLPHVQVVIPPLTTITDYKIKTDDLGKISILFSGGSFIQVAEYENHWRSLAQFDGQADAKYLQIEGDGLGNKFLMWKKGDVVLFSRGEFLYPPSKPNARITQKRFAAKTVKVLQLNWTKSTSPAIKSYKIFKNNFFLAEIPASQNHFIDRRPPRGDIRYTITATNDINLESRPLECVIRN